MTEEMNKGTEAPGAEDSKYCILENDGVTLCVCKYKPCKQLKRLEQENKELKEENKSLYKEKNCLHKIIDRLLENAGYSKDIASAEDFEDVYEDMKVKRNELNAYNSALEEILESAKFAQCLPCGDISDCDNCDDEITNNGQFCMHKRIEEIKAKINEVLSE